MKIRYGFVALLVAAVAFAGAGEAVARGGGGGGGVAPVVLSTSVVTCPYGPTSCTAPVVGADQTVRISVSIQSDAGDVPSIVETAGPALVPVQILPTGRGADAHGAKFGIQNAIYEWTPTPAEIGIDASASFTATTASGKTVGVTVPIGIVQDVPHGLASGLTATRVGANFVVRWNPPADHRAVTYTLGVCPAVDPALGGPFCRNVPLPGVPTVSDPSGTGTSASIPAVFPIGYFTPGVADAAAYLVLRASSVGTFGLQENVLALPQ